jgi:hypothetical protein
MATLADQLEQMRSGLPSPEDSGGSRLTEQLEQMRIRMNDVARREHEMAAELDAAVRSMDEQLLHKVRSIAAAHEARRTTILNELQLLAAQLNGFPQQDRHRVPISAASQSLLPSEHVSQNERLLEPHNRDRTMSDALSRYVNRQRLSH